MPARTTRLVFSFTSPWYTWPSLWTEIRGICIPFGRRGRSTLCGSSYCPASNSSILYTIRQATLRGTPMAALMHPEDFRTALENAIKGRAATKAPFSVAWASGKLTRDHLARWAENHYHYVGPFADYLGYIYARMPDEFQDAKDFLLHNMYEEEIGGGPHTQLLIRFAEAWGTTRRRGTNAGNISATTRR